MPSGRGVNRHCVPSVTRLSASGMGCSRRGSAEGYLVGNDGFLYSKEELDGGHLDWRKKHQGFKIVGEVTADGVK